MKISIFGTTSVGLLIRLVASHIFGTLFAYTVYIRVTTLGDGYIPEFFGDYLVVDSGNGISATLVTF